jgi:hypothetical protein
MVGWEREDRLEPRQDPTEFEPDVCDAILSKKENVVVEMLLEILLRKQRNGHFAKKEK